MERVPTGSAEVVQAACEVATATAAHPEMMEAPSLNATAPVGEPVNVAVKVTEPPTTDALVFEASDTAVVSLAMVMLKAWVASGAKPLVAATTPVNTPPSVGVPDSTPPVERLTPGGRVPDCTVNVGAGEPEVT